MNVLIFDTDKFKLHEAYQVYQNIIKMSGTDDWIGLPKGFDILTDVSVDWMKMIRDKLDEKIKEIENNQFP